MDSAISSHGCSSSIELRLRDPNVNELLLSANLVGSSSCLALKRTLQTAHPIKPSLWPVVSKCRVFCWMSLLFPLLFSGVRRGRCDLKYSRSFYCFFRLLPCPAGGPAPAPHSCGSFRLVPLDFFKPRPGGQAAGAVHRRPVLDRGLTTAAVESSAT